MNNKDTRYLSAIRFGNRRSGGSSQIRPDLIQAQMSPCKQGAKSIYIGTTVRVVTYSITNCSSTAASSVDHSPAHCHIVKSIVRKSFLRNVLPAFVGAAALYLTLLPAGAIIDTNLQMQLGNPSNATADTNNHDHYLMLRPVEAMDYNDHMGQPNWASWDLTSGDVGSSGRSSSFYTDTNLPPSFYRVPGSPINPFSGSGYDRGHMCPSDDRTTNTTDRKSTRLNSSH